MGSSTEKEVRPGIAKQPGTVLRILILIGAIAMITAGLCGNGFREVLSKAVMICMECIGIG